MKHNGLDNSLQNSTQVKIQEKGGCPCPICLEVIIDSAKAKKGQDAIFSEGKCSSWLHRNCAALLELEFTAYKSPLILTFVLIVN